MAERSAGSDELRVGVIGLGMMGEGIAGSLLAAGFATVVYDTRPEAVLPLVERGAVSCGSPAEVARSADVVVVVVRSADQVSEVLFAPDGIAGAGAGGVVVLICSTIDPAAVQRYAADAMESGVFVIDVGIAGGPDAAATGTLVALVGGDPSIVVTVGPVLDAMSADVIHAGPLGAGMKLKLVKNTMSYLTMCAVHESLLLGEELGFDAELVHRVADRSHLVDHFFWFPMSRASAHPLPPESDPAAIASARNFAGIARKDLAAAQAVGADAGLELPVTELAHRLVDRYFLVSSPRT